MHFVDFANEAPASSKLGLLTDYLVADEVLCPIDSFLSSMDKILRYGTEERLNENEFLGRLLAIGLVSAAEAYIRHVFSAYLLLCPVARANAGKHNVPLGGILWHGQNDFSRSAFEGFSFASKDEICKGCKNFLGIPLEDSKFKSLFDEFEKVCQMRHGVVHGDGFLPGRNAVNLDIPKFGGPVRITIRYTQLQEIAAVISTLVLAINRELFENACRRWAIDWRQRVDWEPSEERARFRDIWRLFHSRVEASRRKGRSKLTLKRCVVEVRVQYGLSP